MWFTENSNRFGARYARQTCILALDCVLPEFAFYLNTHIVEIRSPTKYADSRSTTLSERGGQSKHVPGLIYAHSLIRILD